MQRLRWALGAIAGAMGLGGYSTIAAAPPNALALTAPGMYITVGNHQLHLNCRGAGAPTVVLESGLGGNSLDWSKVQPTLSQHTRTCSYDRAGYGWSEPGPAPRSAGQAARELQALLTYASESPPYVLAGHSMGGWVVRLFARRHPEQVAALVLIDAAHEEQFARFERAGLRVPAAPRQGRFFIANNQRIPEGLPDSVRAVALALAGSRGAIRTLYAELGHLRRSAAELQGIPMPNVPVLVLARNPRDPESITTERQRRLAQVWWELQQDLAARAPQGRLLVGATTAHYLHLMEPSLVTTAIESLIDGLRASDQADANQGDANAGAGR